MKLIDVAIGVLQRVAMVLMKALLEELEGEIRKVKEEVDLIQNSIIESQVQSAEQARDVRGSFVSMARRIDGLSDEIKKRG